MEEGNANMTSKFRSPCCFKNDGSSHLDQRADVGDDDELFGALTAEQLYVMYMLYTDRT